MVYYKEETKMKIIDDKTVAGIEETVVKKFDEAKAVSENKTRVEKMRLIFEMAQELRASGYYNDKEFNACTVGIGNVLGFKFESFKN